MSSLHRVSVVIVNYNTRDQLRRCLASLPAGVEVVVVDNASVDGSVDMVRSEFPAVVLSAQRQNLGFGAANNVGAGLATGEILLYLNSDAWATPGAIERLAEVFEDPGISAAGGKLLNPDGSLQESCSNELTLWVVVCEQLYLERLFPASKVLSPYWMSHRLQASGVHTVAQVMGACLMTRRLEGFDERFFLYCEDTELCARLARHGRIVYVPEAEFYHELGTSSRSNRWLSIARYNRGKELYFEIHKGRGASFVCLLLNRTGALLRLLAWGLPCLATLGAVGRLRNQAATFWRVLTAPREGPPIPSCTPAEPLPDSPASQSRRP